MGEMSEMVRTPYYSLPSSQAVPGKFSTDLFKTFSDKLRCKTNDIIPFWPASKACVRDLVLGSCEHFGENAHELDGADQDNACSCYACLCICGGLYSARMMPNVCLPCSTSPYRGILRNKYNIPPTCCCCEVPTFCGPCGDYCTHCWCGCCSECQENNEMFMRGLRKYPAEAVAATKASEGDSETEHNALLGDENSSGGASQEGSNEATGGAPGEKKAD